MTDETRAPLPESGTLNAAEQARNALAEWMEYRLGENEAQTTAQEKHGFLVGYEEAVRRASTAPRSATQPINNDLTQAIDRVHQLVLETGRPEGSLFEAWWALKGMIEPTAPVSSTQPRSGEEEDDFILRVAREVGMDPKPFVFERWKDGIEVEYVIEHMKAFVRAIRGPLSTTQPPCPYCTSDNDAIRDTYFDQTCRGCVSRMGRSNG